MGVSMQVSERNRVAAASRIARVQLDRVEARERVITRLLRTTEVALARELEILVAGGFTREDLQAITNSRMKAIQQFELLEGRVTDRQDYGAEAWLAGVNAAIHTGLEVLPDAMAQLARDAIANALREVQEKGMAALPVALDDDEAEDGEYEVVGEVTA